MIIVHHLEESRSQRVLWLLEELSLQYEVKRYGRDPQTRLAPPELKAIHPLGKSPVVEVDGRMLAESGAILEYFAENESFGALAVQPGHAKRADYLFWLHFAEGSAMLPILLMLYVFRLGEAGAPLHPRIQSEIANHLGFANAALGSSDYFVDDRFTAADIQMSFVLDAAGMGGQLERYPNLARARRPPSASGVPARARTRRALSNGRLRLDIARDAHSYVREQGVLMRARDCKIVATLGPASDPPERLMMLVEAGVDCFRLNFSHGGREDHARRMAAIRSAEERIGKPLGVFADLQGPKIRVGAVEGGELKLRYGQVVTLEASAASSEGDVIRLPHPELVASLEEGDILKLDDGKMQLTVIERHVTQVRARVDFGGVLRSQKGVNVPTRRIPISALTEKDREDLAFALDLGVDYVALSFVQHPDDVREARGLIGERAGIVSKIEKPTALEQIEELVELSDAVMVARGDLGVELPPEMVPIAQRKIIRAARAAGRPVIVATHMLESMVDAPTPTRAEASDVATAVYQGADAVMLSAESAVGRHPSSAVAIMDRIIRAVENDSQYWAGLPRDMTPPQATTADAIALSARHITDVLDCAAVVAFTATGSTALRVARERPRCGVVGLTPVTETARRLTLVWGVRSVVSPDVSNVEEMVASADEALRNLSMVEIGDRVVVIAGIPFGRPGKTNTIRIFRVE